MSAIKDLMDEALRNAPSTVINVVTPDQMRFAFMTPTILNNERVYLFGEGPKYARCYDLLQQLSPLSPVTFEHCRAYQVPQDFQVTLTHRRQKLVDYALSHTDEAIAAFLLTVMFHRISNKEATYEDIYVSHLSAVRLTLVEAQHLIGWLITPGRPRPTPRQQAAETYMKLYWYIVSTGHLRLAGTPYEETMYKEFKACRTVVAKAMTLLNAL